MGRGGGGGGLRGDAPGPQRRPELASLLWQILWRDFSPGPPTGSLLSLPSGSPCALSAPSPTASQSDQLASSRANPAQLCTSGEAKCGSGGITEGVSFFYYYY